MRSALIAIWCVAMLGCQDLDSDAPTVQIVSGPVDIQAPLGAIARFEVTVEPTREGIVSAAYRWSRRDANTNDWREERWGNALLTNVPLTLDVGPLTAEDDGATFKLSVMGLNVDGFLRGAQVESVEATLTVLTPDTCVVPPRDVPFDRSAPPTGVVLPPATYGANLLANPGFEASVYVGDLPNGFGYWAYDEAVSAPAQQGITPRSGERMLHFVGSTPEVTQNTTTSASEQLQLVDVSSFADDIDADLVRVHASAYFARVVGCVDETDDAFQITIVAFTGGPESFPTKWRSGVQAAVAQGVPRQALEPNGDAWWLSYDSVSMRHNDEADRLGDVFDWRQAEIVADLPSGTRYVAILLVALENVELDLTFPEFHGHYADDAEVVLTLRD